MNYKPSKTELDVALGRLEKSLNVTTVTVCADCLHGSGGDKRKNWVCLARPINRDIVDGEWFYVRCQDANNGDCEYFHPGAAVKEKESFSDQPKTEKPRRWWHVLVGD
jgi:hypothetical protein